MNRAYRQKTSKSGLFLLELIIGILFFSFASAICMQIFVKAHLVSTKSSDLTAAMTKVQSAAEAFKSLGGNESDLAELLNAQQNGGLLTVSYDNEWNPASSGQSAYRMTIQISEQGSVCDSQIRMFKGVEEQPIYELDVKKYRPRG